MKEKRAENNGEVELPSAKRLKKLEASDTEPLRKNGLQENENRSDQLHDEQAQKKGRKRKRFRVKKLRQDISKQLEFYFCDANLRKDRYMKELVAAGQDGCA